MKYLLTAFLFLMLVFYFVIERIAKIIYILFSFLWDFKPLESYEFDKVFCPFFVFTDLCSGEVSIKEYFTYLFTD